MTPPYKKNIYWQAAKQANRLLAAVNSCIRTQNMILALGTNVCQSYFFIFSVKDTKKCQKDCVSRKTLVFSPLPKPLCFLPLLRLHPN